MPPALKALAAQIAGWIAAFALVRSGALPAGLWPLVAAQALCAVAAAAALRSARWWLPIHLAFTPLAVAARTLNLAPGWYLAAFVGLLLIYWTSFRTQVPLYLSNRPTAEALAGLLPESPARMLDIGGGTGSLLRRLAALRPDCRFCGVELAPGPWLAGKLLLARQPQVEWRRTDLFSEPWADYDLVYAFLSPVPMEAVWRKAVAEMRPGSLLVSNTFDIPGRKPDFVVEVADRRATRLLAWRIPAPRAPK
ncbi:class I SAM-dependent methyltransferase [Thauera sinica]|uniref:Class I SAM-dependent methyltransferase n=1 Tax=Thauera sinica TaxID=2665146 RepID=A0ABW1AVU8_9RHOO|nr:class I SAM-dependent methyltransferase [Thauera sp. K11]ATE61014.1 methyltransferase type 12 [Thauera sp. K11]